MTAQRATEGPRRPRGPSSWAQRVNDNTAEWVAAVARIAAVAGIFVCFGTAVGAVWHYGDLRWWGTWLLTVILTLGMGRLGFIYLADPEWKEEGDGSSDR